MNGNSVKAARSELICERVFGSLNAAREAYKNATRTTQREAIVIEVTIGKNALKQLNRKETR